MLTAAALLLAAGCGTADTGQAGPSSSTSLRPSTTVATTVAGDTSTAPIKRHHVIDVDELAFTAGELPTTVPATTTPPSTAEPADGGGADGGADSPVTTGGSGAGPVTTTGGGGGGDVSIYRGVLGSLGQDDPVSPAVAPPPAVIPGTYPLTGLPGDPPNRPAAVVKIDNGSRARPQTGLNAADLVIEEEVEGGITRFAAVFHSTPTIVGPIRSARTTDIGILNGLGSPLLLYSGANQVTDALIRSQPRVQNRNAGTSSGYWRSRSRRAPSNLYSDTAPHWASAAGGPPPPQFAYRSPGDPVPGTDVSSFTVAYRASKAAWSWDGSAWLRSQGGRNHTTASGQRVTAANVVVIEAEEVATGMVDSSGSNVPEFVFVGTGPATVFTAGKRISGVWTRPTLASVATLTTADGSVIELTPGRTWIELIRAGSGILR